MAMRWLYHVMLEEDLDASCWGSDGRYRPSSLEREGFIHASYRDSVLESAQLYFPKEARLVVLAIDPRRLDVPVHVADTPRGPMPHIHGAIAKDACTVLRLEAVPEQPDELR
jgi:uncharacterized protein (DUF952 family)